VGFRKLLRPPQIQNYFIFNQLSSIPAQDPASRTNENIPKYFFQLLSTSAQDPENKSKINQRPLF